MAKRAGTYHRWRRRLAPARNLRTPFFRLGFGVLVGLFGIILSFQSLILPGVMAVDGWWIELNRRLFGNDRAEYATHFIGGILIFGGIAVAISGYRMGLRRLREMLDPSTVNTGPGSGPTVMDAYKRRAQLALGPRVVAIGGGTGLSTLLRGLKNHTANITAVVTVTDDGGSSGRLVQEMGILPPGDLRNCLVALANAEGRMTDLFQHRFRDAAGSLSGHSIGNLLLAALIDQARGDVDEALRVASEVLNIRGRVVPTTTRSVVLRAQMEDGSELTGETRIAASDKRIRRLYLDPPHVEPHPAALEAIAEADLIIIGPGSVYTSVLPNLLVEGLANALNQAKVPRVYVCNVMTQKGESDSFTAAEHIMALEANIPTRVVDHVLVNTGVPSSQALERYRESAQEFVAPDIDRIHALGYIVVPGDLMSETDVVRHDPVRLANRVMDVLYR